MSFFWASPRQSVIVQLATLAEQATDGASPYDSSVGIRIESDGGVYAGNAINGGALTLFKEQDWIIPNGLAGNNYECRVTSVNHNAGIDAGSGWASSPGADGTWFTCGTDRLWTTNETAVGDYTTEATMEIRVAGGTTLASATFSWKINNII
jgi:hypothetical protein